MENLSAEQIMSLVSLTLIEGEGVHYHYDPETQFYNKCHSEEDGKFCSGEGISGKAEAPRDSDGKAYAFEGPVKRGKRGGSLVDPHEGTIEFDGVRGYNKETGKPVPGTDAWLEAHGMSREIFNARPYVKFEADKNDPALHEAFERGTPGAAQWDRLAGQEGQEGGYIMYKHPVPDSPYGPISPQVRPNEGAVTNFSKRKQKEVQLANAKQRYKDLKTKIKPDDLVKEQEARVKKAELHLERTKTATPEIIRAEANKNLDSAKDNYAKAKLTKDPDTIQAAKKDLAAAKRDIISSEYKASKFKPESAIYHAEKELASSKQKLAEIKEDPKGFLAAEIIRQGGTDGKGGRIKRAENAFKDTKAKYLFTRGADTARIDMNPDKQNVKNLMEGKGRIYFAMEGSIKNDALLAAVKREDPTAAVVNVPSVTLWHNKSAGEGEIQWFARTHGKNRQIVLVPDADGVKNVNVMRQANALAAALKTHGASQVLVAAPPTKHGTKNLIDKFALPSGAGEERKGIDDHLGAGRGTLGQLAYQTDAKLPKFSLAHLTRGEGNTGDKKLNRNALKNHENMLNAISGLAGTKGAVQVSKNLLMQTSGITSPGSAIAARDKLQDLGIIDVRYVFDKDVLAKSRKRVLVMPQKEVDSWVKQKVIKPLPEDLFAKDDYEASPIIVIKDPKYIVKQQNSSTGVLSDLPDWSPPKSYNGWRSPLTGRPDSTGIAASMANNEAKTKAKNSGSKVSVAKTAEQRVANKVAPVGRRLVRTAEGAKRYGVAIGQPIPLSANAITSTVLLSAVMSEEDLQEFYNRCHDENGRFCEGEGGTGVTGKHPAGSWPRSHGSAQLYYSNPDGGTVDGILDVKTVHEIYDENGRRTRLYDKTGNAPANKVNDILRTQSKLNDIYHLRRPIDVVVTDPDIEYGSNLQHGDFAESNSENDYTLVNVHSLGIDMKNYDRNFNMPSSRSGNTKDLSYLVTHEFGHHVDFNDNWSSYSGYKENPLWEDYNFRNGLSDYGKKSSVEAYAETFAEWHHSEGRTTNPSAIAMARYEGWNGNGYTSRSDEFSSYPVFSLTSSLDVLNVVSFEIKDGAMAKDKKNAIAAIDNLEEGPRIIGQNKITKPSEEEISKAKKIMAEVLAELEGDSDE